LPAGTVEIPTLISTSIPTLAFTPTYNLATLAPTAEKQAPLEIAFPTPLPEEERDWRPPLYPIPWALGSHDHFYFARPISADVVNWPLWNYRYGGTTPAWEGVVHTGIDIDAPMGTPVRASAPGRVLWAGYGLYNGKHESKDPYGLAVTLMHDFGFEGENLYTIYAHMNEVYVQPNQMVNTGDVLGIVGQTGATTGPHLHFEVRWKQNMFNSTLNPELWLAPPQGWGVLAGRVMNTSGSFYTSQDVTVMRADKKQTWIVRTYGDKYVRSDPYYQENVVLSDLPAGKYVINIEYEKVTYKYNLTINAGAVTYFRFKGTEGFTSGMPAEPKGFSPAPQE
jgi:murein DD-endopeptidase MepM/ murein hydrolase activator NlpD